MPTKEEHSIPVELIEGIDDKIFVARGQRVMLDSDLAVVYQVETRVLKQAVRRNRHRFPDDFMFELSDDEIGGLHTSRSQSVILNEKARRRGGNIKYPPFVFTEHGAVMLASVLNSTTAVQASIVVVRAFVKMRAMLELYQDLADRVDELEKITDYHGQKFGVVSGLLSEIMRDPKYLKRKVGFVEAKKVKAKK